MKSDSRKDTYTCSTITTSNTNNNIEFKKNTMEESEFCSPEKSTSRKALLIKAEENQKTSIELKTHDGFHSLSNFRVKQNEGCGEERRVSEKGNF